MATLDDPIRLESACGAIDVYAHGGQVVGWRPPGGVDSVLWLSPHAVFDSATAIRGGVPVCFPWFGPGRSGDMSPAHGFARTTQWAILRQETTAGGLHTVMRLDDSMATDPQFPYPYDATLEIIASDELVIRLSVRNTSSEAFTYEEALHAYLSVGDVAQVRIDGLDGATYRDKTRGGEERVQRGDLHIDSETDRAYRSASVVRVHDPVWQRTLVVTKKSSASTIIWNPGRELASRMADIGPDAWSGFVCVEAGNVLEDAVTLEPGQEHILEYRLAVLS